ncbi:MATE family efflux transporter [Clostridium sp.]|uniref:MATE family efflux transporter n=1 Tax=Clostridium sp. TaxID=1506 RepID=UPI0026293C38|nr:MATE family efflux transporter [Clostridium sp.]
MSKNLDLIKDKESTLLRKYMIPSVTGMLGLSVCILFDTMFIGHKLGDLGLAALNIALPTYNIYNAIGLAIGVGGATTLSIALGQKKNHKVNRIFTSAVFAAIIFCLIINILEFFFLDKIVYMLGASEATFKLARDYLKVILTFNSAFIFASSFIVFVRNDKEPKLAMYAVIASNTTNIILDYVFIYILNMGMFGAALATSIGQFMALGVLSIHFIKKNNSMHLELSGINLGHIGRVLRNGVPSFLTEISAGFVIFIFNIVIYKFEGDLGVSAYGIITNIVLIFVAIFNGVSQGVQPLISVNYGAGKEERVIEFLSLTRKIAFILGVIFLSLGLLFPDEMIFIFTNDRGRLLEITKRGIYLYFIAFLFNGLNMVNVAYLQAVEKSKESSLLSSLRGLIFIIVFIMILPRFLGVEGVWLTIPSAEFITLLLFIFFEFIMKKKSV